MPKTIYGILLLVALMMIFIIPYVIYLAIRKKKEKEEMMKEIKSLHRHINEDKKEIARIKAFIKEVDNSHEAVRKVYIETAKYKGYVFKEIPKTDRKQLGTLVNDTLALALLINKKSL